MHKSISQNNLSVPEDQISIFRHVIKQLGFGKSLANVTLPSWFLEHRSILERFTDWMLHADILRKMNDEELPELRMLHICTWIISGFHMTPHCPKKPYSSLRGECFRATLYGCNSNNEDETNLNSNNNDNNNDNDEANNTNIIGSYIAEQVTQHPSVCAFHYKDRVGNIIVWGNSEMRSKISFNSVAAIMDNPNTKVNVEHLARGESYFFNFPDMYGRGVFSGPKILEIVGKVRISCKKTGYFAKINFLAKGLNSSKTYNSLKGKIYKFVTNEKGKPVKETVIRFQGHWDDKVYYSYADSKKETTTNIALNEESNEDSTIPISQLQGGNIVGQSHYPEDSTGDKNALNQLRNPQKPKISSSSPSLLSIPKPSKKSKKSTGPPKPGNNHLMFDAKSAKMLKIVVPPIDEQSQYESRFVWRRVTECLERNNPEEANLYQKALTENLKKTEKCFELTKKKWTYQLFDYNEKEKRFIPKDLDLSLYQDGEPPLQMHPGFQVPPQIVALQEEGQIKTTLQIQQEVDESINQM